VSTTKKSKKVFNPDDIVIYSLNGLSYRVTEVDKDEQLAWLKCTDPKQKGMNASIPKIPFYYLAKQKPSPEQRRRNAP
jgi:hypothetical protein